ncbi:MAG: hypothetical protein OK404_00800 [Thaumarchaeota archaeon]|nr:hypothetical protein [Nitrososphaerota archaeon]
MSSPNETILAQEQGAMMRAKGIMKEVEAEFGFGGVKQGTLVLTNSRLIFVCTDEKEIDLPSSSRAYSDVRVLYSDVEDLESVPKESPNVFIPISSVSSARGHKRELEKPSLEVEWGDGKGQHGLVFTEELTGRRKRNLNDWAGVIDNLKAGRQKFAQVPQPPSMDSLEGKIAHVMSDMQEKGLFTIEDAVETEFKVDLDPDEVEAACERLVKQNLLIRSSDSGETYYRRVSSLGDDSFSS